MNKDNQYKKDFVHDYLILIFCLIYVFSIAIFVLTVHDKKTCAECNKQKQELVEFEAAPPTIYEEIAAELYLRDKRKENGNIR